VLIESYNYLHSTEAKVYRLTVDNICGKIHSVNE